MSEGSGHGDGERGDRCATKAASNMLTSGSEVIAVLDFDEVALDYCVSDLANAFVLLGTRFTNWQPTTARFRDAFLDGYQSVRPLTRLEHQWLHALVLLRRIQAIPPGDDPAGWARALLNRCWRHVVYVHINMGTVLPGLEGNEGD